MSELHEYTEEFFEYIERGSIASAKRFSNFLVPLLGINSLLDIGCGRGAWLREWRNAGVKIAQGADGPYVRQQSLLIPVQDFTAVDLSKKFDLQRRYDLVSSLEVAEPLLGNIYFIAGSARRPGSVFGGYSRSGRRKSHQRKAFVILAEAFQGQGLRSLRRSSSGFPRRQERRTLVQI